MSIKTLAELVNEKLAEMAAEKAAQDAFYAGQPARERAAAVALPAYMSEVKGIALGEDMTVTAQETGNSGRDFRITLNVPGLGGQLITKFFYFGNLTEAVQYGDWLPVHNGATGPSFEYLVDAALWLFERSSAGVLVDWPEMAEA